MYCIDIFLIFKDTQKLMYIVKKKKKNIKILLEKHISVFETGVSHLDKGFHVLFMYGETIGQIVATCLTCRSCDKEETTESREEEGKTC